MKPQYEWDGYEYVREYFLRMMKDKDHLPFRTWLVVNQHIAKGARITSYNSDYIVRLWQEFKNLRG